MTPAPEPYRNVPTPRLHPELEWLDDYTETFKRITIWRDHAGRGSYEAVNAHDGADEAIMYRVEVTATGTAIADRPDLGVTHYRQGLPPLTRITAVSEPGRWINLDGSPADGS